MIYWKTNKLSLHINHLLKPLIYEMAALKTPTEIFVIYFRKVSGFLLFVFLSNSRSGL